MLVRDSPKGDPGISGIGAFEKAGIGTVLPSTPMRKPLLALILVPGLHVAVLVPLNVGAAQTTTVANPSPRSGVSASWTPLLRFQRIEYPARITVCLLPKIRLLYGTFQATATRGPKSLHDVVAELLRPGTWRMGLNPNVLSFAKPGVVVHTGGVAVLQVVVGAPLAKNSPLVSAALRCWK